MGLPSHRINRDARNQASPEACALAAVHARWSPHFGFDFHDQGRRVSEMDGWSGSRFSLLRTTRRVQYGTRTRAMRLAAVTRIAADFHVVGRVTCYDDAHNPHAFGDAMQSRGTSTVVLETGVWENDRRNEYLRQVNFVLLLTALDAGATGSYIQADVYDHQFLPGNPGSENQR